jgi:hypothetical protein
MRLEAVGKRYGLRQPWIVRHVSVAVPAGRLKEMRLFGLRDWLVDRMSGPERPAPRDRPRPRFLPLPGHRPARAERRRRLT